MSRKSPTAYDAITAAIAPHPLTSIPLKSVKVSRNQPVSQIEGILAHEVPIPPTPLAGGEILTEEGNPILNIA